jgi:hypothetical protein
MRDSASELRQNWYSTTFVNRRIGPIPLVVKQSETAAAERADEGLGSWTG